MKIVITGGLGYIGTELCKIYSGESRRNQVIVLDNRFLPERVAQLRKWGINFVLGSILDETVVQNVLLDADIVYHLAGITDVAYVKSEANTERDNLIRDTGVLGTRNIIKYLPAKTKLMFPSTHVVFEGLKEVKLNIEEKTPVCPELTYSLGKVQNEKDIIAHCFNFVILRLGSCYGLSSDSMRMNIMPNLFARIAALNGEIKLFAGGKQYKSLVHVTDVARCFKYLAESDARNEIFHISHDNTRVKDVAAICQQINPAVKIVTTDDEAPNAGYTLSNQKLLDTGFSFLYSLKPALREMIDKWMNKALDTSNERIMFGTNEFIDKRGQISNYELPEHVNLVGLITSKGGSVRANHYHPIQEQKCLLISGSYISVTKDLLKPNAEIETKWVRAGELSIIPPNVAHAMIFLSDSVFVNLVNGEREHANYGVTHTIPYVVADEQLVTFLTQ